MKNNIIVETLFKIRSKNYEKEASWITDENFIRPLRPADFNCGSVLDVCAGTGTVSKYFNRLGFKVIATDLSQDMMLRIKGGIKCVVADANSLPFEKNSFDLVTCRQGLHYLDMGKAFESMNRVADKYITLGHITIHDKEDIETWKHYYSIAVPCRKVVFYPGQIGELGKSHGLTISQSDVVFCKASLDTPIKHLDDKTKKTLKNILFKTSEIFKKRNGLSFKNGELFSIRRWEFIVFQKNKINGE